ncbi:MAG TPA: polynucleotide adenylyltransferase PcnB [Rhizobacter sp.]|nr:polynucleotide adenylyltransferase PcnB [Rhizobacter sp.]
MIKKFIDKLLGKSSAAKPAIPKGKRVEVPLSEHNIDIGLVEENAIRVVKTLADAGYEAYIVGGAVRDLLVGLRPKDFDVATNATPEQVKGLFRRAFIIGRRFRIVHVVFGRGREHEVIEVSTFRAVMDAAAAEQVSGNEKTSKAELANKHHAVDAAGRVLRDNVWGPQIEDAARRDFTVNAMYYDPQKQIVVDYHGGIKDAKKKVLRMIGDPATRYREDPIRIVRVIRFAAKLGFTIDPKTRAPIQEMAALLESIPASRSFDEMIKLLQTGHALSSIEELRKQGLVGARTGVFPILDVVLADAKKHPERAKFVELALADTDRRVNEGKPVAPSFMLACMLWHDVLEGWHKLKKRGEAPFPALQQAVDSVFDARIGDISGRGKLGADMREIWLMQTRFERRTGQGPLTLVEQPRFRAGFDFLRLRAEAGEIEPELAQWWEAFSLADPQARAGLIEKARGHDAPRRRAPASSAPQPAVEAEEPAETATDAPRKRRRRRRKPGGAGADTGASSNDQ